MLTRRRKVTGSQRFQPRLCEPRGQSVVPPLPASEEAAKICLVMSGGTEGGWRRTGCASAWRAKPRDALRWPLDAPTPHASFHHLGRSRVDAVAQGVRTAMADAGITHPDHASISVQIKCPLLTAQRIGQARRQRDRGGPDTLRPSDYRERRARARRRCAPEIGRKNSPMRTSRTMGPVVRCAALRRDQASRS